jgi:ParB family chromosome partitioning protein
MRLLSLSSYVQEQLIEDKVSQGHAKVLVGLDEKKQKIVIDSVIGQKLSVRDTENMVKKYKENVSPTPPKPVLPSLLAKYEDVFKEVLPFKHMVKAKSIEVSFENEKEIEDFLEQFQTMNDTKINTLLKRILK